MAEQTVLVKGSLADILAAGGNPVVAGSNQVAAQGIQAAAQGIQAAARGIRAGVRGIQAGGMCKQVIAGGNWDFEDLLVAA